MPPEDQSRIYFGAYVTLEEEDGKKVKYRLVGPDEIDPQKGYISIDSPMGKSLLGKCVDHGFVIKSPAGIKEYYIVQIEYADSVNK
jgi:transcription elongation factor GreB